MAANANDQRELISRSVEHQSSHDAVNGSGVVLKDEVNRQPETQTSIDPLDVSSASGDNDPSTSQERQRVDSLSQQPKARPPSFIDDTENPEINRSGSLVRARAPSLIDPIRDTLQKKTVCECPEPSKETNSFKGGLHSSATNISRIQERKISRAKTTPVCDPNQDQSIDGANGTEDKREHRDVLTAPSKQDLSGSMERKAGDAEPASSTQTWSRSDYLSSEYAERECNDIQTVSSPQIQSINHSSPPEPTEREHDGIQPSSLAQCMSNRSSRSESLSSEKSLSSYDGDPGLPSSQEETSVNCNSELWFGGMEN